MGKYTSLGTACQITSQDMSPLVACLLLMLFTVGNSTPVDIINGCTAEDGPCTKEAEETTSVSPDHDQTVNQRRRRQPKVRECTGPEEWVLFDKLPTGGTVKCSEWTSG